MKVPFNWLENCSKNSYLDLKALFRALGLSLSWCCCLVSGLNSPDNFTLAVQNSQPPVSLSTVFSSPLQESSHIDANVVHWCQIKSTIGTESWLFKCFKTPSKKETWFAHKVFETGFLTHSLARLLGLSSQNLFLRHWRESCWTAVTTSSNQPAKTE